MQVRIALLFLLTSWLAFAAQANADTLYKNGPVNGICDIEACTADAWTINFGYSVTDSFTIGASSTIQGFNFASWLFPGDTLTALDWSIGTCEFCADLAKGTASGPGLASTFMSTNQYGYGIFDVAVTGLNVAVNSGPPNAYWLTLQNAVVSTGDPVYWDENGGPSIAWTDCIQNGQGCIPSESFSIAGTPGTGGMPEPGSIVLFGTGVLAALGVLRRKFL